jgi:hypothetical protein
MKKIYVSGAMSDLPDLNWPKFDYVSEELRQQGYDVVNPADIARGLSIPDSIQGEKRYIIYIKADLKALIDCDCIYMLSGWEGSRGANMEYDLAVTLGLEIIFEDQPVKTILTKDKAVSEMVRVNDTKNKAQKVVDSCNKYLTKLKWELIKIEDRVYE